MPYQTQDPVTVQQANAWEVVGFSVDLQMFTLRITKRSYLDGIPVFPDKEIFLSREILMTQAAGLLPAVSSAIAAFMLATGEIPAEAEHVDVIAPAPTPEPPPVPTPEGGGPTLRMAGESMTMLDRIAQMEAELAEVKARLETESAKATKVNYEKGIKAAKAADQENPNSAN